MHRPMGPPACGWIPPNGQDGAVRLSAEQAAALEHLADVALQSMQKANSALDQAFEEIEATKAHFAPRRRKGSAPG